MTAFRAPEWSINGRTPWALELLAREGFTRDASMAPVRLVGSPDLPRHPHVRTTPSGSILEVPPLVADRFGKSTLPHLRWLFVDTDATTGMAAVTGSSTTALAPEDVLLTPLRRPTHYLTREGLPAVDAWLPHEELFRMPKTPATEGVRGLGRLALCDHYHVIAHRVRTALEAFLSPTAVEEADRREETRGLTR